jgi:serine/threonine protein phosphatase PrpC
MQNDENIAIVNTLEDLEKNNFNNNLVHGHLFHIRENNFNPNKIIKKKETTSDLKSDTKEKDKIKATASFKSKSFLKRKNKHYNSLFDKKDVMKTELNINEPEITNYESRIFYFQNVSISNKNKEGVEGINQDSFLELLSINGNKQFHLFGVMDGHGVNGHIISKYISRFISEYFISEKIKSIFNNCKNNDEIYCILTMKKYSFIKNLIYKCSYSLYNDLNYECDYSGSTCLLIFIIGNNLICSNIGNSRAIILEKTELLQLSIDQTLNDPEEMKRIIKKGGKIKKSKKKYVLDSNDINNKNFEISRSIGDKKLKNLGIIYSPVITEYTLNKKTKFLIMGTQGLWKTLSNEKAAIQVNKSLKSNNPLDSCRLLIQKIEDISQKTSSFRDDITIITIFFEEIQTNIIKNASYE